MIERNELYPIDKVAKDLAWQYAKKVFGRRGNVCSLREGTHGLPPHRYWQYEGYIGKLDKLDGVVEGRCIEFEFAEDHSPIRTETKHPATVDTATPADRYGIFDSRTAASSPTSKSVGRSGLLRCLSDSPQASQS